MNRVLLCHDGDMYAYDGPITLPLMGGLRAWSFRPMPFAHENAQAFLAFTFALRGGTVADKAPGADTDCFGWSLYELPQDAR